jgi:predicted kinase
MEAVIFIGIQGAGKSSFYQQRFFHTHVRINLDMLKTRHRERLLLEACLKGKQPFVVDNTNVTAAERARYIAPARAAGFAVIGYYFSASLSEALERNRQRMGRARIPEKGVLGTYKRLELPQMGEGFDQLYYVEIDAAGEFKVKEWINEIR